jgi:uncharacterized membrane protein YhaH (DUF805 family)
MAEATAASSVGGGLLAQLLTFRGRANRAKYWIVLGAAWPPIVWTTVYSVRLMQSGMTGVAMAMTIAIVLPAYVIMTLAAIRRLHDRDKRGHWLWLFWFAPIILHGAREAMMWPDRQEPNVAAMGLAAVAVVLFVWGFVELGFLRGTRGPNRFGADPLQTPAG